MDRAASGFAEWGPQAGARARSASRVGLSLCAQLTSALHAGQPPSAELLLRIKLSLDGFDDSTCGSVTPSGQALVGGVRLTQHHQLAVQIVHPVAEGYNGMGLCGVVCCRPTIAAACSGCQVPRPAFEITALSADEEAVQAGGWHHYANKPASTGHRQRRLQRGGIRLMLHRQIVLLGNGRDCLLYTSPSPRDS